MSDLIEKRSPLERLIIAKVLLDGVIKDLPSEQPEPIKIQVDPELTRDEFEKLRKDLTDAPIVLMPSAQPEQQKDIIQKFHDYQVEWLKSHYDIELEPQLEEMIVRFLHDTANCYMMEVEHD